MAARRTYRGFDTFFGYYTACEADYWYHGASGGYPNNKANCSQTGRGVGDTPTDLSNSSGTALRPASLALNGTYNTQLLANEAARLVQAHAGNPAPFYMYLAFMAVHAGCTGNREFKQLGIQAPLSTVHSYYNNTVLDTYKVAGAMYTEMDTGIGKVVDALKTTGMWNTTVGEPSLATASCCWCCVTTRHRRCVPPNACAVALAVTDHSICERQRRALRPLHERPTTRR